MNISLISVDETFSMLGLRDISSVLKNAGHEVKLLSIPGFKEKRSYNNKQLSLLTEYIQGTELLGVSSMALNKTKAIQVLALAREMGILSIWGGIHPTIFPGDCCRYSDYVCVGEGEGLILDFVNALEKSIPPNDIQNLAYIDNKTGKCVINPVRPLIQNLDSLPFPDNQVDKQHIIINEDLYTIAEYISDKHHLSGRSLYIHLYSSRGCPNSCTYCSNSKLHEIYSKENSKVRFKSVERVIEELKVLKEVYSGFRKVWIMDDSFLLRKKHVLEKFKREYIKHIDIPLDFLVAPNLVSNGKFEALLPIEMSLIRIGVQSGSYNTLRHVYNRRIDNKYVINASTILSELNMRHNTNINAVYQFIINNPYEEEKDLIETVKLIRKIKPPFYISMFFLTYFPGTKLYDRAVSDGVIQQDNDRSDQEFLAENYENHLTKESKNLYLNSFLFWMHGCVTRYFIGAIPRVLVGLLVSKPMIFIHNRLRSVVLIYNRMVYKRQKSLTEFLDSFTKEESSKQYRNLESGFEGINLV